jgi:DNA-binding beta-propeller fold protein YncE
MIIDGVTGKEITTLAETKGADEVWYNSGDNNFYAPSGFGASPTLSVIDGDTGEVTGTLPAGPGSHSVAAFRGNNHVFVPIAIPTANAPGDACNVMFGLPEKHGCIAVYAHEK